jgi:septum formation protein
MNQSEPLILASQSPRRRELMTRAGYDFRVDVPDDSAECGVCSQETPPELVARLAFQKAANVAQRTESGVVIGCDTVAECQGSILGKPADRQHARQMLQLMRGREHRVYSGLCLWKRPEDVKRLDVDVTRLRMAPITDEDLEQYLETDAWEGKAGAFGYQDGLPWIEILAGSASNVVGLPMELLERMLAQLAGDEVMR